MFNPDDQAANALEGIAVLLNFAGPFAQTAAALMQACIKAGVDYLDITAQINVYRQAEQLGAQATGAGVMLLPGVGWDVVPTNCLAMQVARRVQEPHTLRIAFPTASCWRRSRPIGCWIRLILCRNQQIKRPPRH